MTTVTPEKLAADAAQLAADRVQLDKDRQAFEVRERATLHKARVAEFSEFTGGLVKAGKLLPLHQASLVAVMAALPDTQVVEFAEGDATVNKPAVQVLRDFLGQLPKVVDFTERARDTAAGKTDAVDFSDPMSIHAAATAFIAERAKAGQEVPHHEAVAHVMRQAEA